MGCVGKAVGNTQVGEWARVVVVERELPCGCVSVSGCGGGECVDVAVASVGSA